MVQRGERAAWIEEENAAAEEALAEMEAEKWKGEEEWPPPALFAGNVPARLKKARDYLRDVLRGLDSADEEGLATVEWRAATRRETGEILGEVQRLIKEVRKVLADAEESGEI
jgi:hypothetical protein